ncbi:MAG: spore coat protein [Bacilli bacterium]|nr:spore coat protein [Bacilli bacterium]
MDNKLIFENYLLVLKSTVEVYVHGTLESSNEQVRMILKENLNETMTNQALTFNLMKDNNWYQIENIAKKEITNTLNKLVNN